MTIKTKVNKKGTDCYYLDRSKSFGDDISNFMRQLALEISFDKYTVKPLVCKQTRKSSILNLIGMRLKILGRWRDMHSVGFSNSEDNFRRAVSEDL